MPTVALKPGHVQPVWSGHPWVYAQAVASIQGGATAGDEVSVVDPHGNFLGRGFYSPGSAIPVRIATRSEATRLDAAWLRASLSRAHQLRREMGLPTARTNAFRLVHAEGDLLPGLIVDRFADVAAVQLTTIGMHVRRELVLDAVQAVLGVETIVDRSPAKHATAEGFTPDSGVVRGRRQLDAFRFMERGFVYEVPLTLGQKTGYYFDQRPLRARIEQLARGRRVLDGYCFVGSFAMAAARGGATEVHAVDENLLALEVGARLAEANGVARTIRHTRSAVRDVLAAAGRQGGYDLVLLDPPSMAPSARDADRATRAFRRLAADGCRAVRPGGLLVVSSCSAAVTLDGLTRAVALGARDAATYATVVERWFQGADHPVPAAFSEGLYLKSMIARIEPR
ncbi:MAG: class I SAM-dependent rRNA methyltransferase [Polyangiaceae bacterium]|nr:class I SAM-dependent rRNA methyltransferase [Polyangiaceae bacterium]